jgi:mannose-6-phosphate isomerase-like protein (cupin superfamily)
MRITRRHLAALVPVLAAAQTKEAKKRSQLPSQCYKYEDLAVKKNGVNESRDVFDGLNRSDFQLDIHITNLGPGMAPHAPHHHIHEEIMMLRTGELDVTIDGKTTRVTAGSVVFVHSNEEHGWKNPGPGRAEYFVMAVGRDV